MSHVYKILAFLLLVFSGGSLMAQANPDPCDFPSVTCQNGGGNGIVLSSGSDTILYPAPGTSAPFWVGLGDVATNDIDTSAESSFFMTKQSGPGEILGSLGGSTGSYVYYNDVIFTKSGDYVVQISASATGWTREVVFRVLEEIDFCSEAPAGECGSVSGNQIFVVAETNIIPVDAVLPIKVGAIDSLTGLLDSTFSGTIFAELSSGPGIMYGSLSMTGMKWFVFNDIRFSEEGDYVVNFYEEGGTKFGDASIEVEVIAAENVYESISSEEIKVFPNPIGKEFAISSSQNLEGTTIEILDLSGKRVYLQAINENVLKVFISSSLLKSGVYFVKVSSNENVFSTVKVVK